MSESMRELSLSSATEAERERSDGGADGGAEGGKEGEADCGAEGGAWGGADGGADGGRDGGADGGADGGRDGGADGGVEGCTVAGKANVGSLPPGGPRSATPTTSKSASRARRAAKPRRSDDGMLPSFERRS